MYMWICVIVILDEFGYPYTPLLIAMRESESLAAGGSSMDRAVVLPFRSMTDVCPRLDEITLCAK